MTDAFVPPARAPIAKTVKYSAAQEPLVRRLGAALIVQWDALPDDLQDLLIDQAALVEDREDAPHAANDIENFIRKARTTALSAPVPKPEQS